MGLPQKSVKSADRSPPQAQKGSMVTAGVPSTLERREKGPTSRRPHTLRTSQGQPRKPIRGSFTSPGVSASAGQHWISSLPQRQADAPSPVWAGAASA